MSSSIASVFILVSYSLKVSPPESLLTRIVAMTIITASSRRVFNNSFLFKFEKSIFFIFPMISQMAIIVNGPLIKYNNEDYGYF